GKHRSDGPKADNALTIKPDHPMGARQLIRRTIRASNSKDYDQKSIKLLCEIFEPEPVAQRIENEHFLLCLAGGELVGTVGLKGDFLRSIFVEPVHQVKGLGKAMVARIEEEARRRAMAEIMVHSSLTAQDFYAALSYEFVELQTYPEGPFILMRKPLQ
ncbi:MAG: GNAT family N-acetyltransferase, partial [Pseudomonadota bacterium]